MAAVNPADSATAGHGRPWWRDFYTADAYNHADSDSGASATGYRPARWRGFYTVASYSAAATTARDGAAKWCGHGPAYAYASYNPTAATTACNRAAGRGDFVPAQ